jgi:hypothetical protein
VPTNALNNVEGSPPYVALVRCEPGVINDGRALESTGHVSMLKRAALGVRDSGSADQLLTKSVLSILVPLRKSLSAKNCTV